MKLCPRSAPEFGLEAEVFLARALRLPPPAVRLAARQIRDELQIGRRNQIGVGKVRECDGGGLGALRTQSVSDQVEGALVNLEAENQTWNRMRCRILQIAPRIHPSLPPLPLPVLFGIVPGT